MYCPNCGKEVPSQARFCPGCGNPLVTVPQRQGLKQTETWAQASLGQQSGRQQGQYFQQASQEQYFQQASQGQRGGQDQQWGDTPKRSKLPFVIAAIAVVLAVVLAVVFLVVLEPVSSGPLSLEDMAKTDAQMAQALTKYDTDGDNSLSTEEMAGVVSLEVEGARDITVLRRFENLRQLKMVDCRCQHVDLTHNVNLKVVVILESPDVADVKLPDGVESAEVGDGISVVGKNIEERWVVDSVSLSDGSSSGASSYGYTQEFNDDGQVVSYTVITKLGARFKGTGTVSYDASGCLEKISYVSGVSSGDVKVLSVADGKVSSFEETLEGITSSYSCEYDDQGRLTRAFSTSGRNNYSVALEYAPDGSATASYSGDSGTYLIGAWAYDKQGRLAKYCRQSPSSGRAGAVSVATLSYDSKGNCTHAETVEAESAKSLSDMKAVSSYQVDYAYDEKGRAVSATTSLGGKGSFSYDDNGNMTHYEITIVYGTGNSAPKTHTGDITYRRVYVAKGQQVTSLVQAPTLSYDCEMIMEPESQNGYHLPSALSCFPPTFNGFPWWDCLPKGVSGAAGGQNKTDLSNLTYFEVYQPAIDEEKSLHSEVKRFIYHDYFLFDINGDGRLELWLNISESYSGVYKVFTVNDQGKAELLSEISFVHRYPYTKSGYEGILSIQSVQGSSYAFHHYWKDGQLVEEKIGAVTESYPFTNYAIPVPTTDVDDTSTLRKAGNLP